MIANPPPTSQKHGNSLAVQSPSNAKHKCSGIWFDVSYMPIFSLEIEIFCAKFIL
jgi:hypothetical protein